MYSANRYVIRLATALDAPTLRRLAALDGQRPLSGPVLVGERIRAAMAPFRAAHTGQS
jgi:hypothetical protein